VYSVEGFCAASLRMEFPYPSSCSVVQDPSFQGVDKSLEDPIQKE
jgi:hypothetical protein